MLQKTTKIIAIIGAIFCIVSMVVFIIFFYVVEKQKVQFVEQEIERAQVQANKESLSSLVTILENTQEARASLRTRIIEEDNVIDLLAQIESIGKEQNVELVTNSLTVTPLDDVFETLVIQISVEGPYESIIQVLKLLEYLPYQSSITSAQIVRILNTQNKWDGTYVVHVTKFKKNEI